MYSIAKRMQCKGSGICLIWNCPEVTSSILFNLYAITETYNITIYYIIRFTYIKISNNLNAHIDAVHGASAGYIK